MKSRALKKEFKVTLARICAAAIAAEVPRLTDAFEGHRFEVRHTETATDVKVFVQGEFGGFDMLSVAVTDLHE